MPQHRRGEGQQRVSAGRYKEDKAAGLVEIKTKVKDEVFLEKKRFNPHTGAEMDSIVITATKESLQAEKEMHQAAIVSIDEFIVDIDALP